MTRFLKPERRIRPTMPIGSTSPERASSGSGTTHANGAVSRSHMEGMAAFAQASPNPPPSALGRSRQDAAADQDMAVASVSIQLGVEPFGKIDCDGPIARHDVPVFERRAPGLDVNPYAAIA